jgi:hypothetical protein
VFDAGRSASIHSRFSVLLKNGGIVAFLRSRKIQEKSMPWSVGKTGNEGDAHISRV